MFSFQPSSVKNPTIEQNKALFSNKTHTFVSIKPEPSSNEYTVLLDLEDDVDHPQEYIDHTGDGLPLLPKIYIGSLTILGLYIFYKLLQKK
jgi:hypothetical protein